MSGWITPTLVALGALAGVVLVQERQPQPPVTEKITFRFNEARPTFSADSLRLISFGYPRMLSNLLWLRFLQATPTEKVPPGEISWIYYDLETITTIDSDFVAAFEHAGIFLSVITEDKVGAERLLAKGIRLHPDRWRLYAYLAYHFYFELGQSDKAGELYLIGSRKPGAPPLLGMLAARYLSKEQSVDSSIQFLEELKEGTKDEAMRERLQERIDMWKRKKGGSS